MRHRDTEEDESSVDPSTVPRKIPCDVTKLSIGRVDAFLLSQIDGRSSVDDLASLVGLPIDDACAAVARLHRLGAIRLPGGAVRATSGAHETSASSSSFAAADALSPDCIPRLRGKSRTTLDVAASDGFVLAQVDGVTTVTELAEISGLELDALIPMLRRLEAAGAVDLAPPSARDPPISGRGVGVSVDVFSTPRSRQRDAAAARRPAPAPSAAARRPAPAPVRRPTPAPFRRAPSPPVPEPVKRNSRPALARSSRPAPAKRSSRPALARPALGRTRPSNQGLRVPAASEPVNPAPPPFAEKAPCLLDPEPVAPPPSAPSAPSAPTVPTAASAPTVPTTASAPTAPGPDSGARPRARIRIASGFFAPPSGPVRIPVGALREASLPPSSEPSPPQAAADSAPRVSPSRPPPEPGAGAAAEKRSLFVQAAERELANGNVVAAAAQFKLALACGENPEIRRAFEAVERMAAARRFELQKGQGEVAERDGRWADAVTAYTKAHTTLPEGGVGERLANALRLGSGDLRVAAKLAEEAVLQEPMNAGYHVTLGEVYADAKLELRAQGELKKALEIAPSDPRVQALAAKLAKAPGGR